jgi:hypothetical protein
MAERVSPWVQLQEGVRLPIPDDLTIPPLTKVEFDVRHPPAVVDVEKSAQVDVERRLAGAVTPGMTVAVGGGSRGLVDRVGLLRGVIAGLRSLGAEPFVVPAMGSHGGATVEGQAAMLESLGVTEASVGAPVRSSMQTVEVARTPAGMPLYLDENAAGADRILPVNRIKPHTCFKGPIESGCTKMAVVGFGKQPGAAQIHSCGPIEMRDRILSGIDALRATGRLLGGVATVESSLGEVVRVEALTADDVGGAAERELTEYARGLVPGLPFPEIDVLIVERGGKDISGTTLDPNVTGRFWVHGLDDSEIGGPSVRAVVLLSITEVSAGNVLGIGLADFIPAALANEIDWQKTYVNCFTAGIAGLRRARMPMVLPDEEACIKAAMMMCGVDFDEPRRIVRIESTLHATTAWISDALLADLPAGVHVVKS